MESYINQRHLIISLELDKLKDYADSFEGLLARKKEEFTNSWQEDFMKLDIEQQHIFGKIYAEEYLKIALDFSSLFRTSFFLTCYSVFEKELMDLCFYFQSESIS